MKTQEILILGHSWLKFSPNSDFGWSREDHPHEVYLDGSHLGITIKGGNILAFAKDFEDLLKKYDGA